MIPLVEINIPLNGGGALRYGLAVDDHCVVVLQWHEREQVCSGGAGQATTEGWIEAGWRPVRHGYIPSRVAAHMSSLAVQDLAHDAAGYAVLSAQYPDATPVAGAIRKSDRAQI